MKNFIEDIKYYFGIYFPIGVILLFASYAILSDPPKRSNFRLRTNRGGTILFKAENVSCDKEITTIIQKPIKLFLGAQSDKYNSNKTIPNSAPSSERTIINIKCLASGVRTDLVGDNFIYSSEEFCTLNDDENIPCIVGKYFNKFNPDEKGISGKSANKED